jgi:hypothetical protein
MLLFVNPGAASIKSPCAIQLAFARKAPFDFIQALMDCQEAAAGAASSLRQRWDSDEED